MQLKKSTSVSIKMRYATLQMRQLKRMSLKKNESCKIIIAVQLTYVTVKKTTIVSVKMR